MESQAAPIEDESLAALESADALSALRWTALGWGFFVVTLHAHCGVWLQALGSRPAGWAWLGHAIHGWTGAAVLAWLGIPLWRRPAALPRVVAGLQIGFLALAACSFLPAARPSLWPY